jgi:fructoselysine 3-epimerase
MNQHYRRFSLEYFLDSQRAAGIESVELWCGAPHFWIDSSGFEDCRTIAGKAAERGLSFVSITVPSFAGPYQYAAPRGFQAERSFRYFSNGIRVAAELGCHIMTVNSGWGGFSEPPGEAWKRSAEMLHRLCDVAGPEGVTLALESLRSDESDLVNDLASARRMIGEVAQPSLKAMIDTIASGAARESLGDWFDAFGRDLVHMHFLDGDPYVHGIWGDGNYPLEAMLQTLNDREYSGFLVQEIADDHYFEDPARADIENMRVLERYIVD